MGVPVTAACICVAPSVDISCFAIGYLEFGAGRIGNLYDYNSFTRWAWSPGLERKKFDTELSCITGRLKQCF